MIRTSACDDCRYLLLVTAYFMDPGLFFRLDRFRCCLKSLLVKYVNL